MKLLQKIIIVTSLISSNYLINAEIRVYPFDDLVKEERFNVLVTELRCPKCQNNNLADSNAPLAVDLKEIIYEKIMQGETDQEIISYLKQRYGDFISYRPPVKPSTWLIWYGPFVFLLLGGVLIARFVSGRQIQQNNPVVSHHSAESEKLIEQWSAETVPQQDAEQGDSI